MLSSAAGSFLFVSRRVSTAGSYDDGSHVPTTSQPVCNDDDIRGNCRHQSLPPSSILALQVTQMNQAQSKYKHSLTFHVRAMLTQQRNLCKTCALIANPPNSAQLDCTFYYSPNLHPRPCSSVRMRRGTDRQTHRCT